MALLTGLDELNSNNTFSDWLSRTNILSVFMRNNVVTANSSTANTIGNARIIGSFQANTITGDELNPANLTVTNSIKSDLTPANNSFDLGNTSNHWGTGYFDNIKVNSLVESNLIPANNSINLGNTSHNWGTGYFEYIVVSAPFFNSIPSSHQIKASGFTAAAGYVYLCNTYGGAFEVELPASPNDNDVIGFVDDGENWTTHNLTINGNTIMGDTSLVCDIPAKFTIVYKTSIHDWRFSAS